MASPGPAGVVEIAVVGAAIRTAPGMDTPRQYCQQRVTPGPRDDTAGTPGRCPIECNALRSQSHQEAMMAKVRVAGFSVSLDGYGAGPEQSIENPLGKRGMELHEWAFGTKTFRKMAGNAGGSDGVDEDYAARSMAGFGAFILGRNMFGPVRGAWPDESWKGWWGDNPPYHTPVFVLTHYARAPIEMEGGTVFHFGGTMLFEIGAVRFQPVSDLETRFRRVSQAFLLLYPHLFTPHDHG
jgi:dihydrofolate reductase